MPPIKSETITENPKCPVCGSDSWKNGTSRTHRRRYKCKSCGKRFDERAGTPFHWAHKPVADIITALTLYLNYPFSSYKVKEILGMFGVDVSARQIERWRKKFGPSKEQIFKRFRIQISRSRQSDEFSSGWSLSEQLGRTPRKTFYKMTVLDPEGNVVASYLSPERPSGL